MFSTIACARRLAVVAGSLALLAACAAPPVPDAACVAFRPIYFDDDAIAALRPFRQARIDIGNHNETYARLCPPS